VPLVQPVWTASPLTLAPVPLDSLDLGETNIEPTYLFLRQQLYSTIADVKLILMSAKVPRAKMERPVMI